MAITKAAVALLILGAYGAALAAQASRTVWDGVYTAEQAQRGAVLFDKECASCHGPSGTGGGMAPALLGSAFSANYDGLTVGELFDRNRTTMPVGKEGAMSGPQIADVTAFMLQCNDFPAGDDELLSQLMVLKSIKYLALKP